MSSSPALPVNALEERLSRERAEPRGWGPAGRRIRAGRRAGLGLAALLLAGCQAPVTSSPELIELSNIKPANIVPKSTPSQLVSTFRRVCLADSLAGAEQALRKRDYIRKPRRGRTGVDSYVVDNRNPAVMLSGEADRFSCVVLAEARTGQTNRIEDFVKAEFPKAVEIDPRRIGPRTERAWLAAGPNGGIIYTQRVGPRITPQELIFGIVRPEPS